jgi:hypothetical protein
VVDTVPRQDMKNEIVESVPDDRHRQITAAAVRQELFKAGIDARRVQQGAEIRSARLDQRDLPAHTFARTHQPLFPLPLYCLPTQDRRNKPTP